MYSWWYILEFISRCQLGELSEIKDFLAKIKKKKPKILKSNAFKFLITINFFTIFSEEYLLISNRNRDRFECNTNPK